MNYSTKNSLIKVSSLELDLSLIDEDPNQPRTEFDPVTLQELSDTIRLRGVKTPISVHPHPQIEGRFIINHGARRFRASLNALTRLFITITSCVLPALNIVAIVFGKFRSV